MFLTVVILQPPAPCLPSTQACSSGRSTCWVGITREAGIDDSMTIALADLDSVEASISPSGRNMTCAQTPFPSNLEKTAPGARLSSHRNGCLEMTRPDTLSSNVPSAFMLQSDCSSQKIGTPVQRPASSPALSIHTQENARRSPQALDYNRIPQIAQQIIEKLEHRNEHAGSSPTCPRATERTPLPTRRPPLSKEWLDRLRDMSYNPYVDTLPYGDPRRFVNTYAVDASPQDDQPPGQSSK